MTQDEICDQLGATPIQAQRIHTEILNLSSGHAPDIDLTAAAAAIAAEEAEEAAAMNTAATHASIPDMNDVDPGYNNNNNNNNYMMPVAGMAAVGGAGVALAAAAAPAPYIHPRPLPPLSAYYPSPPTNATMNRTASTASANANAASPPPQSQMMPYGAAAAGAAVGAAAVAVPFAMNQQQQQQQQQQQYPPQPPPQTSSGAPYASQPSPLPPPYRTLNRGYFVFWCILLPLLFLVAGADLGICIYMNSKFQSYDAFTNPTQWYSSAYSSTIFKVHYINGEIFWFALFYAAQGFTLITTLVLFVLHATLGLRGSLNAAKNISFTSLLLSVVGVALYSLAICKWTYVILTDYSLNEAFGSAAFPAAAFALEWCAVLLWLVVLVMSAVQLGVLCAKLDRKV